MSQVVASVSPLNEQQVRSPDDGMTAHFLPLLHSFWLNPPPRVFDSSSLSLSSLPSWLSPAVSKVVRVLNLHPKSRTQNLEEVSACRLPPKLKRSRQTAHHTQGRGREGPTGRAPAAGQISSGGNARHPLWALSNSPLNHTLEGFCGFWPGV